jgi:protein subunit release factor A
VNLWATERTARALDAYSALKGEVSANIELLKVATESRVFGRVQTSAWHAGVGLELDEDTRMAIQAAYVRGALYEAATAAGSAGGEIRTAESEVAIRHAKTAMLAFQQAQRTIADRAVARPVMPKSD